MTSPGEGIVLGPEHTSVETVRRGALLELRAVDPVRDQRASALLDRDGAREFAALLNAFAGGGRS